MKTFSLTTAGVSALTVAALVAVGLVGAQAASADTASASSTTSATSAAPSVATASAVTAAHAITLSASSAAVLARNGATVAATTAATASAAYAEKAAWVTAATAAYALRQAASTKAQQDMKKVVASHASTATKSKAKAAAAAQVRAVASAKASLDSAKTAAARTKAAAVAAAAAAKAAAARASAAASALAAAQAAEKAAAAAAEAALSGVASTLIPEAAAVDTTSVDTAVPSGDVTSNGRTWVQSYAEDFNTPAPLGTVLQKYPQMSAYDGFRDTSGQGLYAPDKVLSVANGNLDFHLHSENGQPLVAAVMPDDYAPHTTGRVSIRYKTTAATGYKFVGMFWPSSDDWNDGEIDWPEADLGATPRPASAVPGTFSAGRMNFMPATEAFAASDSSAYHIATTEWDSHAVRYYWDGRLVSTVTNAVPTKPMRVTLQAETFIGQGTVPKNTSGHLDIDWISIWN